MNTLMNLIDRASTLLAWGSRLALVALTGAMLYEVIARYAFNASTIWAFDLSYMATGTAFVLGIAWTAKVDGHVRVDAFSRLLPPRLVQRLHGAVYVLLMVPVVALMAHHGWLRTLRAWHTNEVEMVSVWAPRMWPLYALIAIGLSLFACQLAVDGVRQLCAARTTEESR